MPCFFGRDHITANQNKEIQGAVSTIAQLLHALNQTIIQNKEKKDKSSKRYVEEVNKCYPIVQ